MSQEASPLQALRGGGIGLAVREAQGRVHVREPGGTEAKQRRALPIEREAEGEDRAARE